MNKLIFVVTSILLSLTTMAAASTYTYTNDNPNGAKGPGKLDGITLSYNQHSDELSGAFNFVRHGYHNQIANTAWMVLSDGSNPKGSSGHGVLYMDFDNGDSWLYNYNGRNNKSSFRSGPALAYFGNSLDVTKSNGKQDVEFKFDLSNIQNTPSNWKGLAFGEKVGVWLHAKVGKFFAKNGYNKEEGIGWYRTYDRKGEIWHDTNYSETTPSSVPEIDAAGMPLVAVLLLGMIAVFREKKKMRK